MFRPNPSVLRGFRSASIGRRSATAPARTSKARHHWFHPSGNTTKDPNTRSYHATSITNRSNDETSSSTRTPWSELIASRIGVGNGDSADGKPFERPSWSEEWKRLGLGADLVENNGSDDDTGGTNFFPNHLFFVQLGFGVDQHGDRRGNGFATKAAIRAVRNAIEFNSIPGVIEHLPGGRSEMMIHVKLGVPLSSSGKASEAVDALEVAKVFPYGKLLPIEIASGGLDFHSGRVVEELGDDDDVGICCVACVTIGHNGDNINNTKTTENSSVETRHTTYNTKDGY